ncbi:MAG: hypothetical protein ABSE73_20690 [Planctomycetota bacterium]
MTSERVRELLRVRPFEPFCVHLADGRSVTVKHPEAMVLSASGRTAVVLREAGATSVIDLLLVTELEPLPQDAARDKRPA